MGGSCAVHMEAKESYYFQVRSSRCKRDFSNGSIKIVVVDEK